MRKDIKSVATKPKGGQGDKIKDIIEAAVNGDSKLIAELLENGVDINTLDSDRGFTCLHIACMNGDQDVIDVLLGHNNKYHDLDFTILSSSPPRLAWQLAMSFRHYEIANIVDKLTVGTAGSAPTGPKLVR